ncbi:MAG: hypothetical protein ACQESP_01600 [Candidatus Muiribacteriota bacterium]
MLSKKIFSVVIGVFLSIYVPVALQVEFPDQAGFLIPGNTFYNRKQSDFQLSLRPYKENDRSDYIYNLSVSFRSDYIYEMGITQKFYSNSQYGSNPALSFKTLISDKLHYNSYIVGAYVDLESDNWHSLYVIRDNIGLGFNFGGNNGGDAFFGGYDSSEDKPDKFFLLLKYSVDFNPKNRLGVEFNGDNFSLFYQTEMENLNFKIGYIADNDYDKKYAKIKNNRVVFGVQSEY